MFDLGMLTEREQQIVRLICKGLSKKEVGHLLNLSAGTINVHLHKVYEKIGINDRTMLAVAAIATARTASG